MRDIQDLRARLAQEEAALADAHRQIEAAHRKIAELRGLSQALEKRVKLLREYIEVVDAGDEGADEGADLPEAFAPELSPAEVPPALAHAAETSVPGWLSTAGASVPEVPEAEPLSFEEGVGEEQLANEILPRAGSFEDALLLLLAHHRKALTSQDIVKAFRRLEYAPDVPATPELVEAQLEQRPTFFAHAGRNGFVLTEEGRKEAQRILNQLSL